jgi:hypothetical protein
MKRRKPGPQDVPSHEIKSAEQLLAAVALQEARLISVMNTGISATVRYEVLLGEHIGKKFDLKVSLIAASVIRRAMR